MPEAVLAAPRYTRLTSALDDDDTLVLAASRRLARSVADSFNDAKLSAGAGAWKTPQVAFWQDWLDDRFRRSAGASPTPITSTAVSLLWERCLRARLDDRIIGVAGLARQAAGTWRRLSEWKVPAAAVYGSARSIDEKAFAASLRDYLRLLEENDWIDPPGAWATAVARLAAAGPGDCKRVFLAGFDRLSPLVQDLVAALEAGGATVVRERASVPASRRELHAYIDEATELRAAGAWARQVAAERPGARIAIVVTELEQDAAQTRRLVREGFAPGWQYGGSAWEDSVEVSYGARLADYPAIVAALSCLRWVTYGLTSSEVSVLLRTSCLSGAGSNARASLERRLRRLPDRLWSAAALADALDDGQNPSPCEGWLENVRKLAAVRLRASERLLPSAWATEINGLLESVGWPGDASLSSVEFQLLNRWRELLNQIAALDDVLGEISLHESVRRLAALASDAIYQPERRGGIVEVLGPLEAAGMEFDALRIVRCDADRWPAASHPSSLVSRDLQQQFGLPDASPADTLDYARRVLARLARSSAEVCFSWSRTELDVVRLPSPLLDELDGQAVSGAPDPGWYGSGLVGTGHLKVVSTDPVPAITGEESVSGGARTVQLQRTEPFSAFAVGRLGVRELDPFVPGLNPGLRGSILHSALERLYADRPDRDALRQWSAEERTARVETAVNGALARVEREADAVLRRVLFLERQRMRLLLNDVIASDADRSPFSIANVEERLDFRHAGVRLTLRADRIDQLEDGSLLIIDYKTGRVRPLMDRAGDAADLQLAVYAAAVDGPVGGLSLMHVNRREILHRAAGASIDILRPMDPDQWRATLARWKAEVLRLIEGIARGDARVNLRGDTERHWQLNVLCRAAEEKRAG